MSTSSAPKPGVPGHKDQSLDIKEDAKLGEELNLRRKLLQNSVVKRIDEVKQNGRSSAPWVVELDPTSACNLVCPDCISKDLLNQGGFERQRLREIAEELVDAGVRAVILIGGGEPLAHKETGWVMEYLSRNGVDVGVTTKQGGWGVGLSLARRIVVEVHGGVLRLEESDAGAVFTLELPLAEDVA